MSRDRPAQVFDEGLQHERTALAWERTAISTMVGGILLARQSAVELHPAWSALGIATVVAGSMILLWAARHYDDLHGRLREGVSPVHPSAARMIGVLTVAFTAAAMVVSIAIALRR